MRKPRYLLSGLPRCGCCGHALVVKDRDSKGRRLYCSRMREGGRCTNGRAFYVDEIERRVLAGLEVQLKDPRAIEQFLATYAEERKHPAAPAAAVTCRSTNRFVASERLSSASKARTSPALRRGEPLTSDRHPTVPREADTPKRPANSMMSSPGRRGRCVIVRAFVAVPANAGDRRHALLIAGEIAGGRGAFFRTLP
jgi:hypothetical protein